MTTIATADRLILLPEAPGPRRQFAENAPLIVGVFQVFVEGHEGFPVVDGFRLPGRQLADLIRAALSYPADRVALISGGTGHGYFHDLAAELRGPVLAPRTPAWAQSDGAVAALWLEADATAQTRAHGFLLGTPGRDTDLTTASRSAVATF
jgi:hypothetical protein